MTVLIVVGSLLAVLSVACWWETRRGKPAWGTQLDAGGPTPHDASKAARRSLTATLVTGAALHGFDGGGDG